MQPTHTVAMVESLFWYDRPVVYVCRFNTGALGLAVLIEEVEHATLKNRGGEPARVDVAMVIEVSPRRLAAVKNGCTTMREAFKFHEGPTAWKIHEEDPDFHNPLIPLTRPYSEDILSGGGCRLLDRKVRRPRRILTRRERLRQVRRKAKGVEKRPGRSWQSHLWAINEEIRQRREASTKQAMVCERV